MKKNYQKPEAEYVSLATSEKLMNGVLDPDVGFSEGLPEGWE